MNIKLDAQPRKDKGKGASRRLRHNLQIPAIIYGANKKPINITVNVHTISKMLEDEAIYTSIIDLNIEGTEEHVIIKDMQRHPAKNTVMHMDFQRVNTKVALTTRVPLSFIGADNNEHIKLGAVVNQFINMVEVSCLPKDLPHSIEVDISTVEIGASLRLTDLIVGKGVSITALNHDDIEAYNQTVVSVSTAKKMIEEDEEEGQTPVDGETDTDANKSE